MKGRSLRMGRSRGRRRTWHPDPGLLAIVRVLLLLQAGFALLSLLEVALVAAFFGTPAVLAPAIALSLVVAVSLLALVARLERRSRLARGLVVAGETVTVLTALVDLALALGFTGAPLALVPTLTRLVLPAAVIVLLCWTPSRSVPALGASR